MTFLLLFFKTKSHYVVQPGLELAAVQLLNEIKMDENIVLKYNIIRV